MASATRSWRSADRCSRIRVTTGCSRAVVAAVGGIALLQVLGVARILDSSVRERHHVGVSGAASTAVPYVGRAQQRAAVAEAFAEPGHVVLVCGEAGVGKSSLVAAERAGAVTEVIDGVLPATRRAAAAARRARADLRRPWRLAGDARRRRAAVARAAAQGDPRCGPTRSRPVGSPTPLTLVIDDLQWADETTCDFLVYLASTAARRGLSLVLTLRDDETPRVGRVEQAVSELTRLPGATCVELQRLTGTRRRELVAALTGERRPSTSTPGTSRRRATRTCSASWSRTPARAG